MIESQSPMDYSQMDGKQTKENVFYWKKVSKFI